MNCFKHNDLASVATCNGCQRALCSNCEELFRPPLCSRCAGQEGTRQQRDLVTKYIPNVVTGVLGFMWANHMNAASAHPLGIWLLLVLAYYFGSIPSGWRLLNKITPKIFLFMSFSGWLFYFLVKGSISMFIGVFALPIVVAADIRKMMKSRELSAIAAR